MSASRLYVVVSGPPASGKSTLAPGLAAALGLPVIAKDTIKEALMAVMPPADLDASRRLGAAAWAVLYAVAADATAGAVLDGNARAEATVDLWTLPGEVVEVFCRCPAGEARRRYRRRAASRPGHFDEDRTDAEVWPEGTDAPVAGGWPVIEVDTTEVVDGVALARRVRAAKDPGG